MEKIKFIGGVDFEELRSQRVQVYRTIVLNLATARTDVEIVTAGNYIYALEATDIDTLLEIKLNEKTRSLIPLYKGRGVRAPFYRLWFTNAAQAGKTITIVIGVESDTFEVFDVGKALEITGAISTTTTDYDRAYIKSYDVTGGAGAYGQVQLVNLAGTGVIGYCRRIFGKRASAGAIMAYSSGVALGSNVGAAIPKLLGGAINSRCLMKYASSAVLPGTELFTIWPEGANEVFDRVFNPAFKITEAQGLVIIGEVNAVTTIGFEWFETE